MWLDSVIGAIDPIKGIKRQQARLALQMMQRSYEGAKMGRHTEGWQVAGTSANAEIFPASQKLRNRARDIVRNNAYGKRAIRIHVSNAVGIGILPQPRTGSDAHNARIMEVFNIWSKQCDAEGQLDFYGLQALIARTVYESGECLVRFRDRRPEDGLIVPFQIQVLEPDYLDTTRSAELPNGNIINQGIEFNALGKRVAYYLWQQHPGDNSIFRRTLQSVRVPIDQLLHIYRKERAGQLRGVTEFASVIIRMRNLDEYEEAEQIRKKIEACFTAFVTQNSGMDGVPISSGRTSTDSKNRRIESFEPGLISYLQQGEDVKFGNPSNNPGFPDYIRSQLHAIAVGLSVTYEQLTGDLSQVNYSSLRAGLLEFRRMIEEDRWLTYIPMGFDPIYQYFILRAFMAGAIGTMNGSVEWSPPKFEMIDPVKDAMADTLMMRNGTLTLPDAIAQKGYDPKKQLQTIADTNNTLDTMGIVLDSDPRKTSKNGIIQQDTADIAEKISNEK